MLSHAAFTTEGWKLPSILISVHPNTNTTTTTTTTLSLSVLTAIFQVKLG